MTAQIDLAAAPSVEQQAAQLEQAAPWYDSRAGLNHELIKHAAGKIMAASRGPRALEMSSTGGVMTEDFARHFPHLDVVQPIASQPERIRALLPSGSQLCECPFEDFRPSGRYDAVLLAWVLEYLPDPDGFLTRAKKWLAPGGKIIIIAANAESLHRRVGVELGLLNKLDQLSEGDLALGRRRLYTWDALATDIAISGLYPLGMEGILLKPLSSGQMQDWPAELRRAFFKLAVIEPRLCSEIFASSCRPEDAAAVDRSLGRPNLR